MRPGWMGQGVAPLTSGGRVVATIGTLTGAVGLGLGWVETLTLGSACLLAIAAGVPLVVGRHRLDVERSLSPRRVSVGDEAVASLRVVRPPGRRGWTDPCPVVEDQVDGRRVRLDVPAGPGDAVEVRHRLPTDRRGVIAVGPAVAVKCDLLGLLRREVRQTDVDHLWVHPRTTALAPLGVGSAQNLEGPTSDSSPAGDVSFHALRSYELGDDHRHIHWLSSARAGTLLVRHHVDNRLPWLTVVLDDRPGPGFETALEITASIVRSHIIGGIPVAAFAATRRLATDLGPLLDDLCLLQPGVTPTGAGERCLTSWIDRASLARPETTALVIVSAAASASELLDACRRGQARAHTVAVRVGGDPLPPRLGRATVLRAETLDGFARSWDRLARP